MQYYYMDPTGNVAGPVPKEGLIELLKAKTIDKTTQICAAGSQDWIPITDVVKTKPKSKKKVRRTQSEDMPIAQAEQPPVAEQPTAPKDTPAKAGKKHSSTVAPSPLSTDDEAPNEVVVTNFNMSFGRMIVFMLKLSLAAIPALIILFAVFVGLCIGISKLAPGKFKCPVKCSAPAVPDAKTDITTPPTTSSNNADASAKMDDAAAGETHPAFDDASDPELSEEPVLPGDGTATE
jgi:hypothetical protein